MTREQVTASPSNDAPNQVNADLTALNTHLYTLMLHAYNYPNPTTSTSTTPLKTTLHTTLRTLISLSRHSSHLHLSVPDDVIAYVEQGRNPDIYTREFVEMVQRMNQEWKGRVAAYGRFRDLLAEEIRAGFGDEVGGEVDQVVKNTGG